MKTKLLIFALPLLCLCSCNSGEKSFEFKEYSVVTIQPFFSRMSDISEEPEKGWVLPEGVTNFNLLLNSTGKYLERNTTSITYNDDKFIKDETITSQVFSKLGKNQIIMFEGHGSFEPIQGEPEMRSVMWTGASYNYEKKDIDDDYLNNRLIPAGFGGYEEALDYYFVEEYLPDITGSIVYLGNCYSAREVTFAQSFLKKGAVAVIGNSHTTQSAYSALMQYTTITNLININPITNKPYTLYESFMKAKSLYGKTDQEKKPIAGAEGSEPILFGDPNFSLVK